MLLSLIVPNYKRSCEKIIKEYKKLPYLYRDICELIIVYDGEEGFDYRCEKLISQKDKEYYNISSYWYDQNQGPMYARYYGFTRSSGDYIMFIDSDDYVTGLVKTIDFLYNKKPVDYFIGKHSCVDINNKNFTKINNTKEDFESDDPQTSPSIVGYIFSRKLMKKCLNYKDVATRFFAEELPTAHNLANFKHDILIVDMSKFLVYHWNNDPSREESLYMKLVKDESKIDETLEQLKGYEKKYPKLYKIHFNFINDYMRNHYKHDNNKDDNTEENKE